MSQLTGKRVFLYFLAFFGVITIVQVILVTTAIRTNTGAVTDHPYEKGLAYNEVMDAANAQAEKHWQSKLTFQSTGDKQGIVSFSVRDKNNQLLTPESISATLFRPTQAGMDQQIEFIPVTKNTYEAHITAPKKGSWEMRIHATIDHAPYYFSERVVVE